MSLTFLIRVGVADNSVIGGDCVWVGVECGVWAGVACECGCEVII